jgi:hypothetical protein
MSAFANLHNIFNPTNIQQISTPNNDSIIENEKEYKKRVFGDSIEVKKYVDEHTRYTLPWTRRIIRDEIIPMCIGITFICCLGFVVYTIANPMWSYLSTAPKPAPTTQPKTAKQQPKELTIIKAAIYQDKRPQFKAMLDQCPSFPELDINIQDIQVANYGEYLATKGSIVQDAFQQIHAQYTNKNGQTTNIVFTQEEYSRCLLKGAMCADVAKRFYLDIFGYKLQPKDSQRFTPPIDL